MSTRTFALIFGIVFLIVGAGGFIPGLTMMDHAGHPADADVPELDAVTGWCSLRSGDDVSGHDHGRDRGDRCSAQEIATVHVRTRSRRQLRHLSSIGRERLA